MNTQAGTQKRVPWGIPVNLNGPNLETMKKRAQIVTLEGTKYTLNQDRGKTTLHRVATV